MPRVLQPSPQLRATIHRQDGVLHVDQLCADGFSRRAVNNRVERGRWRRLLPGVITTDGGTPTRRQLLIGAVLWAGPECAIDAADACFWYGLTPPGFDRDRVHVVVPEASGARSRQFVTVRQASARIAAGSHGVVPYVDAATGVVVAARNTRSQPAAIALISRALQLGLVDEGSLRDAREALGDRGCGAADAALRTVGVGVRSPLEKSNLDLVRSSDVLPEPRWNQWLDLGDHGSPVCLDALWVDAGIAQEVLGKRYHAWGQQFEDTEARRARLVAAGLVVMGATAGQIRARQPLLAMLEQTYLRNAGRGMPSGVRLIDAPAWASRPQHPLWAAARDGVA